MTDPAIRPRTHERELIEPVSLTGPDGRLNRAAVGWSRHPLHDTSGIGRPGRGRTWGRNKRWEYWAITSPDVIAAVTVATLDYATMTQVWVLDRAAGEAIDRSAVTPLSRGVSLPGSLGGGPARARVPGIEVDIAEVADAPERADASERADATERADASERADATAQIGTRIRARTDRVAIDVFAERPAGHEALAVVVPWSDRRFQYTVKDVARPAHGTVGIDGRTIDLVPGQSWAVLDHGRGRWPYSMRWHWGAASGVEADRRIGLQLGGLWTAGTGSTENAISVDGRLTKLGDELDWRYDPTDHLAPWRITGPGVDLVFTPFHDRHARTALGIIHSETHQCFGTYSGVVTDDAGSDIRIAALLGWAEAVRNRW